MTTQEQTRPSQSAPSAGAETVQMIIGGERVDAADGQTFDVVNPATGAVIARAPLGGPEDGNRAVEAAGKSLEDPKGWATGSAAKRGRTLAKLAGLARGQLEALAPLERRE